MTYVEGYLSDSTYYSSHRDAAAPAELCIDHVVKKTSVSAELLLGDLHLIIQNELTRNHQEEDWTDDDGNGIEMVEFEVDVVQGRKNAAEHNE